MQISMLFVKKPEQKETIESVYRGGSKHGGAKRELYAR
jgi:hypothetical protein